MGRFYRWFVVCLLWGFGACLPAAVPAAWAQPSAGGGPEAAVPLGDALVAWTCAWDISLIYDPVLVAGKHVRVASAGASPGSTPEAQLRGLLEGSGLRVVRLASGTYVLRPAPGGDGRAGGGLAGVVHDAATGRPLAGAHVVVDGRLQVAGAGGRFRFARLAAGRHPVVATYVGYATRVDTLVVPPGGRIEALLSMHAAPLPIPPLLVEAAAGGAAVLASPLAAQVQAPVLSHALGLLDVAHGLASVPGVRVAAGASDLHLQGSAASEHQVRLDGMPVFEPAHLHGLVSAFSPIAIGEATVHKAGFGAAEGSFLAGVVALEQVLPQAGARRFDVRVDPLSLNARWQAAAGGPEGRHVQLMAAARTGWPVLPAYLDTLLRAWNAPDDFIQRASVLALQEDDPMMGAALGQVLRQPAPRADGVPRLGFADVHGAARYQHRPGHALYASFYVSHNRLNGNQVVTAADGGDGRPAAIDRGDAYTWANRNAQLRYTALLGPAVLAQVRLRGSRYALDHAYAALDQRRTFQVLTPDLRLHTIRYDVVPADDGNHVAERAVEATFDVVAAGHEVRLGAEAARTVHRFSAGDGFARPLFDAGAAWRIAAFAEDDLALGPVRVTAGARFTRLSRRRAVYAEPRLALSAGRPGGGAGTAFVHAAAGLYRQFVSPFDLSSVSPSALLPALRFWLPLDAVAAPPRAYHAALTLGVQPAAAWQVRVETYAKRQPRLLQIDYAALWEAPAPAGQAAPFLVAGRGFAYGGTASVEHTTPRRRARFRYDHSVARRTFAFLDPARTEGVPWNEPHHAEADVDWKVHEHVTLSARYRHGWGRRWGFRQAYYDYLAAAPERRARFGPYDFSEPSRHTLPPTFQLDLGGAYSHPLGPAVLRLRLDVLNVTGHANVVDWSLLARTGADETVVYTRTARLLPGRLVVGTLQLAW